MKIFRRITDGIFNPAMVNNYINDKRIFTAFFFFLMIIIMILPQTIKVLGEPIFTYNDEVAIRELFYHETEPIPFSIRSSLLFNDDHDNNYEYRKLISDDIMVLFRADSEQKSYASTKTIIEFGRYGVFIHKYGMRILVFSYNEKPELSDLKFSDAYNDDNNFWNVIFKIAEEEIMLVEPLIKTFEIVTLFVSETLSILILILILALFNRPINRKELSFSKMCQMIVYLLSPFVFASLLSQLFGFLLLYYIGLLITIINIVRFSQCIIIRGGNNEL